MKTGTFDQNKTRASNIAWQRRTQANAREKPPKPRPRLNVCNKRKTGRMARYRAIRDAYMAEHPWCEAGGCTNRASDPHHPRGRNGQNLFVIIAICRGCHELIHAHPREAREIGLLVRVDGRELGELGRVE